MAESATLRLSLPASFDARSVIGAHGWFQLAPFRWEARGHRLAFVLRTVARRPLEGFLAPTARGSCRVRLERPVGPRIAARVRERLRYMLALDVPLEEFHAYCRPRPDLRWIVRKRLGRFLRGEDVFEDLVKTLLTTNCTWKQTIGMVGRLAEALGERARSGRSAFPSPAAVLAAGESGLQRDVRPGYRCAGMLELAERAAAGELDGLPGLPSEDQIRILGSLRGFGPYAVAAARMLWGRCEQPVIDSWALARARVVHGKGREVKPARLKAIYAGHGRWAGLVQWFTLDRERYEEFPPDWLKGAVGG